MNLLDSLNVLVKPTENFIKTFEKKFQLKTLGFVRIFQPDFGIHFQKISIFSIFLTYNPMDASCNYAFFTEAKIQIRRAYHILWTYSQSSQKSFWRLSNKRTNKKFTSAQKMRAIEMSFKMRLECSDKTLYSELKHFFTNPSRIFFVDFANMVNVFEMFA